jgi:hypothetical protein
MDYNRLQRYDANIRPGPSIELTKGTHIQIIDIHGKSFEGEYELQTLEGNIRIFDQNKLDYILIYMETIKKIILTF